MVLIHRLQMGMANAYLVEGTQGLVLIDCGSPRQERVVFSALERLGRPDLEMIFITHAHLDHYGSAGAIRRETGARIGIHAADAEAMTKGMTPLGSVRGRGRFGKALLPLAMRVLKLEPVDPDILFVDEDRITTAGLEMSVLHTPGHTPGSASLLVEKEAIFVGDLISTTRHPHIQGLYASDWSQILPSLRRIQRVHPQMLYPGHGRKAISGVDLDVLLNASD